MMALQRSGDLTKPVLAEPEEFIERRGAARVTVLIRPGKLIADGREYLCVVRDVSESGLRVRLFHRLPEHQQLEIEFDTGERHALQLVWQAGDTAGCAFLSDVDCQLLLARQDMDFPIRQPRVSVEVQGTLVTGGMRTPITMRNISLRGAMIDCEGWLMIDELVRIECPALPTLHAKIRWRRPPRYGLVFEQTFRIDELARACAELQPA